MIRDSYNISIEKIFLLVNFMLKMYASICQLFLHKFNQIYYGNDQSWEVENSNRGQIVDHGSI